jgi:hypothetical protein
MTMFNEMPSDAKVWVYAANRILTDAETLDIQSAGNDFTRSWTAHQNQLKAAFIILHNTFMVFMVDENVNEVSGCGIDKSVHFMQEIDKKYNLDAFNRLRIELWQNNAVVITNKQKLSVMLQENAANAQTIVFNKTVTTKEQFDSGFQIPLDKSWVYPQIMALTTA